MFQARTYNISWIDPQRLVFPYPVEIFNNIFPADIPLNNAKRILLVFSEPRPFRFPNWLVIAYQYLFDLILSYDEEILSSCKNAKLFPYGTTWIHPSYPHDIDPKLKKFGVSFVCGAKRATQGHLLRQQLWYRQQEIKLPKTFWISGALPIEGIDDNPMLPNDDVYKKALLFDYQFHIAIENVQENNYFSEKLIDCFRTKTIPIYWGCSNITAFFNEDGIISVSNDQEVIDACNSLHPDYYHDKSRVVEQNYRECLKYCEEVTTRLQKIITETFMT